MLLLFEGLFFECLFKPSDPLASFILRYGEALVCFFDGFVQLAFEGGDFGVVVLHYGILLLSEGLQIGILPHLEGLPLTIWCWIVSEKRACRLHNQHGR